MKSLLLAGATMFAFGTVCFADGLYWVVGNRATSKCEIVTSNPVVDGDIRFEDGPYKSLDEAKLARSTIRVCPKDDPPANEERSMIRKSGNRFSEKDHAQTRWPTSMVRLS